MSIISNGYTSPLMSKLNTEDKLSLELLEREIPLLQQGTIAKNLFSLENNTPEEKEQLRKEIIEGEKAQERLVSASLSFVMSLAKKEQKRREQWGSHIPLDDILQEGLAGLIKGLNAYNLEVSQKSATNYLGQWVTTQMRRGIENMDHSFTVPQETIERHRKIRAITSRLKGELGRNPTDQEIVDAAIESKGKYGDTKLGRVNKKTSANRSREITLDHIAEERSYSKRTGSILPTEGSSNNDDESYDNVELAQSQPISADDTYQDDSSTSIDTKATKSILAQLLEQTIEDMHIHAKQTQVIKMKYGLPPYEEENTIKNIIATTELPKHRIKLILDTFALELTTPQSVFHKHTSYINEDLHSIGIGWVINTLGDYDPSKGTNPTHKALTEPPTAPKKRSKMKPHNEYQHIYECPVHGEYYVSTETEPEPLTFCNVDDCSKIGKLIK